MNGSGITSVKQSDEYHHSRKKVEVDMLKENQKRDKRYQKELEVKVKGEIPKDH